MKHLLCALALSALGAGALAASNPGQSQCLPAEKWEAQPLACAALNTKTVDEAGPTSQWLAADAGCQKNCESRLDVCLKEAKTDAIRDKCKVYLKGCLKSCSQGK
jgi:hypothetical protein